MSCKLAFARRCADHPKAQLGITMADFAAVALLLMGLLLPVVVFWLLRSRSRLNGLAAAAVSARENDLQRDDALQAVVLRLVDDAHASAADLVQDLVRGNSFGGLRFRMSLAGMRGVVPKLAEAFSTKFQAD
jgi:hypothetical protein